jgi:CRP-like cAMP-binding protein
VVSSAGVVLLRAHQVIVHAGDAPERMYVLTSGQGQMYWDSADGQRAILHAFGPGGIAGGETILRTSASYFSTTEIVEDGEALTWTRDTIREVAYRHPIVFDNALLFAAEIIQILLAGRISIVTENAEGRLAHVVMELSRNIGLKRDGGVEVEVTNAELADMAHISPYTASRIVSQWVRQGAVARGRGRITRRPGKHLTGNR